MIAFAWADFPFLKVEERLLLLLDQNLVPMPISKQHLSTAHLVLVSSLNQLSDAHDIFCDTKNNLDFVQPHGDLVLGLKVEGALGGSLHGSVVPNQDLLVAFAKVDQSIFVANDAA